MSQSPFGTAFSLGRKKRFLIYLTVAIIYVALSNLSSGLSPENSKAGVPIASDNSIPDHIQSPNEYLVTRIIDGDTIQVSENGKVDGPKKTVRYIGIDTPETASSRKQAECFGKEASAKNAELVLGKAIRLEKDKSDTDRYGRWLRYAYADDVFINMKLVRDGYASASAYPPDIRYRDEFKDAQYEAKSEYRGLWGSTCNLQ